MVLLAVLPWPASQGWTCGLVPLQLHLPGRGGGWCFFGKTLFPGGSPLSSAALQRAFLKAFSSWGLVPFRDGPFPGPLGVRQLEPVWWWWW